jgi:uncharacterized protein
MIIRESMAILKEYSTYFPVVSVTGPRQSGKTTLVRNTFSDRSYVSLENPAQRRFAKEDPIGFLEQFNEGGVIDEIQRVPALFSYIQVIVDEKKMMGQFILTGSNQFEYMHNIAQSLAGRMAILKLLPFSYNEIYSNTILDLDEILEKGMYPAIFDRNIPSEIYYPSYIESYLERDVRQIKNISDLSLFQKFIEICAGRTGRILNKQSISKACGISHTTVEKWLTILEASFIIFRLRPYYKNTKKRLIKSPKLYFFDTGLVCNLLGINDPNQLKLHPLRGEIFETFVLSEFIKYQFNKGRRSNFYYYRDNNMNEIDLIIDTGFGPVPIEIKSSKTVNNSFYKGLKFFRKLSDKHQQSGLIYGGDQFYRTGNISIKNFACVYEMYDELTSKNNWVNLEI